MNSKIFSAATDLRKRIFAWWLLKTGPFMDAALATRKSDLFSDAVGRILEIGAGTGINVRYLKRYRCLTLLEPNPYLHRYLAELTPNICRNSAEHINLPDESVDTVISSLVLCSVQDIDLAIAEIKRVLKPNGTYRFIEHVGAEPGSLLRLIQYALSPLCQCVGDGCHPERDIGQHLCKSGFRIDRFERFQVKTGVPLVRHFIGGVLRKARAL